MSLCSKILCVLLFHLSWCFSGKSLVDEGSALKVWKFSLSPAMLVTYTQVQVQAGSGQSTSVVSPLLCRGRGTCHYRNTTHLKTTSLYSLGLLARHASFMFAHSRSPKMPCPRLLVYNYWQAAASPPSRLNCAIFPNTYSGFHETCNF